MAKRATAPKQKPALRVVNKSPKNPVQPPDGEAATNAADLETFHFHIGQIRRAQADVVAARKVLKTARRAASDGGIQLGHLDLVLKMSEEEPETVQNSVRTIATYATWMGLAPGFQGDLFNGPVTDTRKAAYDEGYREGIEGVTATGDRYDAASEIGQERLRGHADGQKILHDRFLAKQETGEAAKQEAAQ